MEWNVGALDFVDINNSFVFRKRLVIYFFL